MKIESKRLDEKVPLIEPSAREIATFILQGRPEMLEVFSDVLVGCSKYTGNTFVNEKIVKSIERYKYLYPEIAQDIEHLKDLMWEYFSYLDDYKLDALIKENSDYSNNMSSEQQKLNKLRGTLCEVLVEEIIRPRYINAGFDTGCMVILNGEKIISYYENKPRNTIDIAAYRDSEGEFYECKLTPYSLDHKSYVYLDALERRLGSEKGFKCIVACVTLGTKERLKNAQMRIEEDLAIHNKNIRLYGKKNVLQLKRSPFNEAI